MMDHEFTNRLTRESSPYLQQHKHNPVDWFPWGEEAFRKARKEDKPILVSIGYSTCHWCHVMERESFEDEATAKLMNELFVNIKVDREERPDVDAIYMDAIQVLTGSGGWPLNCFLTPDLKPFYGGTYFPPENRYNRPSWKQVLIGVANAYSNKKDEVEEQANRLIQHINEGDDRFLGKNVNGDNPDLAFTPNSSITIFEGMKKTFDTEYGGFSPAPKFPGTMSLRFLLNDAKINGNQEAEDHLHRSLEAMIMGGIYDQIGGGFARYSTDPEWLAPHFEKMLYDNALLVALLADAYSFSGREMYKETILETLEWVDREMNHPEGGFYSALDADSEGVEGKFYVWDEEEVNALLGDDAPFFKGFYDVSPQGNWEGVNILRRKQSLADFSRKIGMEESELKPLMKRWSIRLRLEREKRVRPGLDDKVLLDWNALMLTAYCKAAKSLESEELAQRAEKAITFIYGKMKNGDGFYHSYKDGTAKIDAFLSDYAYLIEALIELYEVTLGECYLLEARRLTDFVIQNFSDPQTGYFLFAPKGQKDLIAEKKDFFDNALPSGNSRMVSNLQRLSLIFDSSEYKGKAREMLLGISASVERYPRSFSGWANALTNEIYPPVELVAVGEEAKTFTEAFNRLFLPNKIVMGALEEKEGFPLLSDRMPNEGTAIYLCSNFSCYPPVNSLEEFRDLYASLNL